MIVPLLLALAVASSEVPVAPPVGPVPIGPIPGEPTSPPATAPESATDEPPTDHNGWRHGLGTGVHSTTFFSKEASQYTFHSASIGYLGSIGARGVFLHLFGIAPLQARQDGNVYATANYYRRRSGADLLAGFNWRWTAGRRLEGEAGPGFHAMLIYLPGGPGFRDFSALPLGIGASAVLWWRTGAERLSRNVTLGLYASAAYDFRDPAHANDLARGYTFRAGVAVGLGARR